MNESPAANVPVTEDGLVLKNMHRIEQIESRLESRVHAEVQSWQIGRILRRDYHIMSAKMYKIGCNKQNRMVIRELLLELALQTADMTSECKAYEPNGSTATQSIPVRIVCAEAASFLNTLKQADASYAIINWGYEHKQITDRRRNELTMGFEAAYGDLRTFLFGKPKSNKTAGEIAKEMGIT